MCDARLEAMEQETEAQLRAARRLRKGNRRVRSKEQDEQVEGKVQEKIGEVKKVVGK